ncbi:unnamed protein product [Calypogeia fissa]
MSPAPCRRLEVLDASDAIAHPPLVSFSSQLSKEPSPHLAGGRGIFETTTSTKDGGDSAVHARYGDSMKVAWKASSPPSPQPQQPSSPTWWSTVINANRDQYI